MSLWYEIPDKDIEIDRESSEVYLLVTDNEWGNIYATLTFDQIKELYEKVTT